MAYVKRSNSRFGVSRRRRILVRALIVVAVLTVVLIGVGAWVARAMPRIAAAEISRLTNTRVEMGAFDFHRNGSVSIDGLVIRPAPSDASYDDAILRAGRVRADFSLGSVLLLSPKVKLIQLDDFILDVQYNLDTQRWNVGDLRINAPQGGSGGVLPTVVLQAGRLRYSKASGQKTEVVMSVPIEARFGFGETFRPGYSFEIKTAKLSGGYGESHLSGYWRQGELALAGGLSSTDIPSLERAWALDVSAAQLTYDRRGNYSLDLRVQNAHSKHSPEVDTLRMLMPASADPRSPLSMLHNFLARYSPFGTVGEITVKATGNFDRLGDSDVTGRLTCKGVSICDRKFPYAINDLTGELSFTESTVTIQGLSGKHGDADLTIKGWTKGQGDSRQYQYSVTSENMVLDDDLYAALQPEHRRFWNAFKPSGVIGAEYRLGRTSPVSRYKSIVVDLQQVEATYEGFPYPLQGLTGKLHFDRDGVSASNVVSRMGQRRVVVNGQVVTRGRERPDYHILIDADHIPLDAALGKALPEHYRKLYEQFDANGVAAVRANVFTDTDPNRPGPVAFFADVSVSASSLQPDVLPMRIADVAIDASITSESLRFRKFTGRYEQSPVTVTGAVRFDRKGQGPQQLHMKVAAQRVSLDEKTVALLAEPMRQQVAAFHPQGQANVTVDFVKADANEAPVYAVAVECLDAQVRHERFAYPLKDIEGTITLGPGQVSFKGLAAAPAVESAGGSPSTVRLDGHLNLANGEVHTGDLTITARNIPFTNELGDVLPAGFGGLYRDLSARGPFDLDVETFKISPPESNEPRVSFAGRASFDACRFNVSGAETELSGGMGVTGTYDQAGLKTGRMELDAGRLVVRGKAITDLDANIVYDPNARRWSAEPVGSTNFLGDCYSGKVLGRFDLAKAGEGTLEYVLQVAFNEVDLEPFLAAGKTGAAAERSHTRGTMNASLSMGARVGKGSSRLGLCKVDVVDMQVGKVSPLANVISVLRLSGPSDYTFERMLIDSYLKRNTLLIQKLDMSGKNMAFAGSGTMDIASGQLALTLTARGKRAATGEPSVLQSLTEGLGSAVVRMEVTGPADNPKVETKTLPVIEDSLKILGTPK